MNTQKTFTADQLNTITVKELIAVLETLAGQPMTSKVKKAAKKADLVNAILDLQAEVAGVNVEEVKEAVAEIPVEDITTNTTEEETTMNTENTVTENTVTENTTEKPVTKRTRRLDFDTLVKSLPSRAGYVFKEMTNGSVAVKRGNTRMFRLDYVKGAYQMTADRVANLAWVDGVEMVTKKNGQTFARVRGLSVVEIGAIMNHLCTIGR